jgi:hypothetical protein
MRLGLGVLLALLVAPGCKPASERGGGRGSAGAAVVIPSASGATPLSSAAQSSAPSDGLVWRTLGTWSGRGDGQTGSFDVSTGALRVTWEARDSGTENPPFSVVLHSAISGRELQTVVSTRGPGRATVYLQDEPRVSYLVIHAAGVEWRVSVDEGAAASPGPPGS